MVREVRTWKDKGYFSPIPQTEINKSPNLIQNPGNN
ncbi:MAG: RagB/SusD family nutrient uptake outer membrane protein [Flavobacteriaceae bacterium]|nr:RagB/SusD family nutrient uptake outer membrane protein [Flavobacteriaceae bacterium]